jgi:hypothetical protein
MTAAVSHLRIGALTSVGEALDLPSVTWLAPGWTAMGAAGGADRLEIVSGPEGPSLSALVTGPTVLWFTSGLSSSARMGLNQSWGVYSSPYVRLSAKIDGRNPAEIRALRNEMGVIVPDGGPHLVQLSWLPNDALLTGVSGGAPFQVTTVALSAFVDAVHLEPLPPAGISLDDATEFLPMSDLAVRSIFLPSGAWHGQSAISHDGVDAAESGDTILSERSMMRTSVTGPGELSFWWKCAANFGGTPFAFLEIDGQRAISVPGIGGITDWAFVKTLIPSGTHTLGWVAENFPGPSGSAKAWVDQISFVAGKQLDLAQLGGGPGALRATRDGVTTTDPTTIHPPGSTVTLTAEPGGGYTFVGWAGDLSGNANPARITMDSSKSVTAIFSWPLTESLDEPSLAFTTGGYYPFIGSEAHGDSAYAIAGPAGTEPSWLQTTVTGPVSLIFDVEGEYEMVVDGSTAWTVDETNVFTARHTRLLTFTDAATHILRWKHRGPNMTTLDHFRLVAPQQEVTLKNYGHGTEKITSSPPQTQLGTDFYPHGATLTLTAQPHFNYEVETWVNVTSNTRLRSA